MVRLPFAENPMVLGKTLALGQRKFYSLERRLGRDPAMLEGYVSFMDEYERLNHMTEVQLSSVPRNHYFIPHHCINLGASSRQGLSTHSMATKPTRKKKES